MDRRIILAVVAILIVIGGAVAVYYYYGYEKTGVQNQTNVTPNATKNLTKEQVEQVKQVSIEGGDEKTIQNTVKSSIAKDVRILVENKEDSRVVIAGMEIAAAIGPKAISALTSETSLSTGTAMHPVIFIKGPKSGAKETKVTIVAPGQIIVEGKTYDELKTASIRVGMAITGQ